MNRLAAVPMPVDVTDADAFPNSAEAIKHRRTMKEQRAFARRNRAAIAAAWDALDNPPLTIAGHVASLSPERREQIEREWI